MPTFSCLQEHPLVADRFRKPYVLNLQQEEDASSTPTTHVWETLEGDSDGKGEGHADKETGERCDKAEENRQSQ